MSETPKKPGKTLVIVGVIVVLGALGQIGKMGTGTTTLLEPPVSIAALSERHEAAAVPVAPAHVADEVLSTARALAVDHGTIGAELTTLAALVTRQRWTEARQSLDKVSPRFELLAGVEADAVSKLDSASQEAVRAALEMRARADAERAKIESFERVVADAIYAQLFDPMHPVTNERPVLTAIARQFHISTDALADISARYHDEIDRHIKARADSERADLQTKCGPKPARSELDGSMPSVKLYLKRSAHDAGSIEVRNCSDPALSAKTCWVTACEVRGKNAFGAPVDSRWRLYIGANARALATGEVISAEQM